MNSGRSIWAGPETEGSLSGQLGPGGRQGGGAWSSTRPSLADDWKVQ